MALLHNCLLLWHYPMPFHRCKKADYVRLRYRPFWVGCPYWDVALVTGTVKIVYIDDIVLVGRGVSAGWSSAWPEWCHQYTIRDYMLFYLQVPVTSLNNQLKRVCIIVSFQVAYCAPWVINTFLWPCWTYAAVVGLSSCVPPKWCF